jgi:cytochrome c oxidase cbb3-type subunit I/II
MIDTLAKDQAKEIAKELRDQGHYVDADREVVALIAYLQCLGKTWEPTQPKVAGSQ